MRFFSLLILGGLLATLQLESKALLKYTQRTGEGHYNFTIDPNHDGADYEERYGSDIWDGSGIECTDLGTAAPVDGQCGTAILIGDFTDYKIYYTQSDGTILRYNKQTQTCEELKSPGDKHGAFIDTAGNVTWHNETDLDDLIDDLILSHLELPEVLSLDNADDNYELYLNILPDSDNPGTFVMESNIPRDLRNQTNYEVYDLNGSQVAKGKLSEGFEIDLEALPNGTYVIKVTLLGDPFKTQKIVNP